MKPNVLLVDPGSRGSKRLYLERLLTYPASFWIVENSAVDCTGRWYRDLVEPDRILAADFRRPLAAAQQIADLVRSMAVTMHGVTTYYEDSVEVADRVAVALGLPRICDGDPKALRHKGAMRDAFALHGVPQPAYRRCTDLADAYEAAAQIGFPCIVKPAEMSASVGVRKVSSRAELAAAFAEAMIVDYGDDEDSRYAYSIAKDVMVEAYVDWQLEISCEGFASNGDVTIIGITEARLDTPTFKEAGHVMPCLLPEAVSMNVKATVRKACAALKLRNTTFHAELLLGADGAPFFLEIGARLPGGYIPFALEAASGCDLLSASIDLCLGITVRTNRSLNGASAIEFISNSARLSMLKRARREIEALECVVSLLFYEGALTGRLGHLIWKAQNRGELDSVHRRIDEIAVAGAGIL